MDFFDKLGKKANETYKASNGVYLRPEDIYKVSYYNDIVDKTSRLKLDSINPNEFPILNDNNSIQMCSYVIPDDFRHFIN